MDISYYENDETGDSLNVLWFHFQWVNCEKKSWMSNIFYMLQVFDYINYTESTESTLKYSCGFIQFICKIKMQMKQWKKSFDHNEARWLWRPFIWKARITITALSRTSQTVTAGFFVLAMLPECSLKETWLECPSEVHSWLHWYWETTLSPQERGWMLKRKLADAGLNSYKRRKHI